MMFANRQLTVFLFLCLLHGAVFLKNLALRHPTRQSSTGADGLDRYAVDGKRNGKFSVKSCSQTYIKQTPPTWWQVDLAGHFSIHHVVLYNRVDCCQERLRNIRVDMFLNDPVLGSEAPRLCRQYKPSVHTTLNLTCFAGARGRFLRITKYSNDPLTLCEVEVFGSEVPKQGALFQRQSVSWMTSYKLDGSSLRRCVMSCMNRGECLTFNFNVQTGECRLQETQPREEPWIYYNIKELN